MDNNDSNNSSTCSNRVIYLAICAVAMIVISFIPWASVSANIIGSYVSVSVDGWRFTPYSLPMPLIIVAAIVITGLGIANELKYTKIPAGILHKIMLVIVAICLVGFLIAVFKGFALGALLFAAASHVSAALIKNESIFSFTHYVNCFNKSKKVAQDILEKAKHDEKGEQSTCAEQSATTTDTEEQAEPASTDNQDEDPEQKTE